MGILTIDATVLYQARHHSLPQKSSKDERQKLDNDIRWWDKTFASKAGKGVSIASPCER